MREFECICMYVGSIPRRKKKEALNQYGYEMEHSWEFALPRCSNN